MSVTLAFDVYGTLIDTHGISVTLQKMIGDKASAFSHTWRDKQLEYSFRRGLMQNYTAFSVCTSNALDYACLYHGLELSASQKRELLDAYKTLPAFADVADGLASLKRAGFRLYAFSNGSKKAVEGLLVSAGISDQFEGIVSCEDLKSFKPNPAVYSHFLRESDSLGHEAWLISSNPFDITGAISAGMRAAWVQRSKSSIFDPWDIQPTMVIESLLELADKLD